MSRSVRSLVATVATSLTLFAAAGLAPSAAQAQTPPAASEASAAAPAPTAAPASLPAAPGAAAAEKVDNPYGLEALWKGSDGVAKGVLVLLVLMSMGSWYIIIVKIIEQAKINRQARLAAKSFWTAGSVRQGADTLDTASPFRFIAESGIEATKKHGGLLELVDLNTWITMSIQRAMERVQSRLQDGLAFLATVGSTAPFVGLLGTVMGIVNAFQSMALTGSGGLGTVSAGIAEALITTAFGLLVAIPAVMAYNYLQGWVDARAVDISESSNEFLDLVAKQAGGPG